MDAQVAWGWEMSEVVYMYTQLYVMPLVLMVVLSAITIYRREISCNRMYALEEGPQRRLQLQGGDQSTSPLVPCAASLFAPLMWFQFDRGTKEEDDLHLPPASSPQTTTLTQGPPQHEEAQQEEEEQQEQEETRDPPDFSNFFGMKWSDDAQLALDAMMARLPALVIRRLSEAIPRRQRSSEMPTPLHPDKFPADVQMNIISYLQPKDVVNIACVSRSCRDIVDGDGPTATAVWKTLWRRDYGWLIHSWEIGRRALLRSNVNDLVPHGKDFYFRFGLSYVNYVLAGLNTPDHTLVGLHGNIYDITDFVLRHPGSPETLFVHAGRDTTNLFDDMDHSRGARRLAKEFCIAVDMSYYGSCGLKPTIEFEADGAIPVIVEAQPVIGKKDRRTRQPECLKKIYDQYRAEQEQKQKEFSLKLKDDTKVLHWTLYYDPYQSAWKTWHTSRDFETVFGTE